MGKWILALVAIYAAASVSGAFAQENAQMDRHDDSRGGPGAGRPQPPPVRPPQPPPFRPPQPPFHPPQPPPFRPPAPPFRPPGPPPFRPPPPPYYPPQPPPYYPPQPPPYYPPQPPPSPGLQSVYRFVGPDFLLSLDANEGLIPGYTAQGATFQTFTGYYPGLTPLYRCFSGVDHFASLDSSCEGRSTEGVLGFIATAPTPVIAKPLYRCMSTIHLITTNIAECNMLGMHVESVLGYVP